MTILIDTNIIMDILLKREPHFPGSYQALRLALETDIDCSVSATAITDIFYLLNRSLKDANRAKEYLEQLLRLVQIADVLPEDILTALSSPMQDFEDAVVDAVAGRYKADYILTRNEKDFTDSAVKAVAPVTFLSLH